MKKHFLLLSLLLASGAFFYHQYRWAGPYDAFLRHQEVSTEEVLKNLKEWRYHTDVWFEIVPDALTTVFKRLGMGGWTETGLRACVEGCVYWTQEWTDGFHSADLELEKISFENQDDIVFQEPRFIDVESWGRIRAELKQERRLPQSGRRARICGPLRLDRPYYVFTLHPDRAGDYSILDTCDALPKDPSRALKLVDESDCQDLSRKTLFEQVALLDSLADSKQEKGVDRLIEKAVACVDPRVLQWLSTNADIYESLVSRAPNIRVGLPPVAQKDGTREGNPVKNTIADLFGHWFK